MNPSSRQVRITYEPPVMLGATASSPDNLSHLGHQGDLEIEVKNSQNCEQGVFWDLRWVPSL